MCIFLSVLGVCVLPSPPLPPLCSTLGPLPECLLSLGKNSAKFFAVQEVQQQGLDGLPLIDPLTGAGGVAEGRGPGTAVLPSCAWARAASALPLPLHLHGALRWGAV